MKILHITGYSVERGGTAKIVYENAQYQISKGHDVYILSVEFENEEPYPLPKGAVALWVKDHWLGKFISNFSPETNHFFKTHRDYFDLIHIHGIWFWGSVAPFLFKNKAKKVITIHGMLSKWTLSQGTLKKKIFGTLFQNKGLKQSEAIFVNTETEKLELLEYIKIDQSKIHVVPNAIETTKKVSEQEKLSFRENIGINKDSKNILFLSRIHKKKGLDLLVKAFALIINNKPNLKLNLLIAGPDEGFKSEIEELIQKLNINEQVFFLGSVSGRLKEVIFSFSDVFALTSHSEGFPMAVLEAIEIGTPVLVSDQTRIDEYIKKYNAGEVVDLEIETIKNALERIIFDEELAKKYVENGHEMLKSEFSPDQIYGKMLSIYESIMEK
jgi:glycosyltransferase involved in cell wall biosynthesis